MKFLILFLLYYFINFVQNSSRKSLTGVINSKNIMFCVLDYIKNGFIDRFYSTMVLYINILCLEIGLSAIKS